jgi:hypothetical protein
MTSGVVVVDCPDSRHVHRRMDGQVPRQFAHTTTEQSYPRGERVHQRASGSDQGKSPAPGGSETRYLESWDEIATYLHISARRAQQWERDLGMPVGRLAVGRRQRIRANTRDIDHWLASRSSSTGCGASCETEAAESRPGDLPNARESLDADAATQATRLLLTREAWVAGAALVVSALAIGGWLIHGRVMVPREVHAATFEGTVLRARDDAERVVWEHTRPEYSRLMREVTEGVVQAGGAFRTDTTVVTDLDGDGHDDVLAVEATAYPWNDAVVAYDRTGASLWSFKPGRPSQFDGRTFDGHFVVNWVMGPVVVGSTRYVIVSASHEFFPCQITLLDAATGRLLGEFWHPGAILTGLIADYDRDGTPEAVLGCVNNPGPGDGLPVLISLPIPAAFEQPTTQPPDFFGNVSAAGGSYVLFPAVDLFRVRGRPALVRSIVEDVAGGLRVIVARGRHIEDEQLHYRLDRSLQVIDVSPCDNFQANHRSLHRSGNLDHDITPGETAAWKKVRHLSRVPNGNDLKWL